jgi:hypothetical protein
MIYPKIPISSSLLTRFIHHHTFTNPLSRPSSSHHLVEPGKGREGKGREGKGREGVGWKGWRDWVDGPPWGFIAR